MLTTIQKCENSQGVRLPKAILEMANLNENDTVKLKVEDGTDSIWIARKIFNDYKTREEICSQHFN